MFDKRSIEFESDECYGYRKALLEINDNRELTFINTHISCVGNCQLMMVDENSGVITDVGDDFSQMRLVDIWYKQHKTDKVDRKLLHVLTKNLKEKYPNTGYIQIINFEFFNDSNSFRFTYISVDCTVYGKNKHLFSSPIIENVNQIEISVFNFEEHHTFLENMIFRTHTYPVPKITKEEIVEWSLLPVFLVNPLFVSNLSALTYEGSACEGHIIFAHEDILSVKFETDFSFGDAVSLRKLLELTDENFFLVVDWQVHGRKESVRIKNSSATQDCRVIGLASSDKKESHHCLHIKKSLIWEIECEGKQVIKYRNGFPEIDVKNEVDYADQVIGFFGIHNEKAETIAGLVKSIKNLGQGMMLVVSQVARKEAERLSCKKRGILVKPFSIYENADALRYLSSIDGAIFIDDKGVCFGFGLIVDGQAIETGDPKRGSRYNSAKNYIASIRHEGKSLAIVRSEDGYIDVFM